MLKTGVAHLFRVSTVQNELKSKAKLFNKKRTELKVLCQLAELN